MPTWANAEVIYYRKDLWEDPDEQAAFMAEYGYELAPPTTWQEFTDMAVFFTRDTDGDGAIDLFGTDVKGAPAGADVEWMVHVLQAGSPGVVLDADGTIIVDNDAHLAGLEYYVSHHCELGVTPPNPLEIGWGEGENLFFQGATAMTRFWGHAYRLHQFDLSGGLVGAEYIGPDAVSNVGVAPMIAGEAGIGSIPGPCSTSCRRARRTRKRRWPSCSSCTTRTCWACRNRWAFPRASRLLNSSPVRRTTRVSPR